ncbi:MAG: A24 family peptidase [Chloroflexota bacterium]|nr:A24 family peptidase [Chloroflexota bacterium]
MLIIFIIFIGILAGGVVNALSDDLPRRERPRLPHYPDGTPRPLSAWLGLTAFLFGKRRSPNGIKLSWRYPLTELATAALMVIVVLVTDDDRTVEMTMTTLQFIFWLIYMPIFVLITVIDLEHRLILFVVIIPSCVVALLDALTTTYGADIGAALLGGALGFGVFFLLYLGGFVFTYLLGKARGEDIDEVAFGYGDVMLITLSGLILGWQPLIIAMFVTVFLGAAGAILYLIVRGLTRKHYSMFTPLPYGPYIVLGTLLMLLFSIEVSRLLRAPAPPL